MSFRSLISNINLYDNEFSLKLLENSSIFEDILKVCNNCWDHGCGSYLFDGQKYEYDIKMYNKQKLLYDKTKNCENILEVGTYMGHSLLIMLLANPSLDLMCIDINDRYSRPATDLLGEKFPYSKIKFVHGDSIDSLKRIDKKFDLFHLDGGHNDLQVIQEFNLCKNLSKDNIIKIFIDDIDSCPEAESYIINNNKILEYNKPNSSWKNCYMELEFMPE